MQYSIHINVSGEAFDEGTDPEHGTYGGPRSADEVARILRILADKVQASGELPREKLFDSNGNTVGRAKRYVN